jgi:hypothetical protein
MTPHGDIQVDASLWPLLSMTFEGEPSTQQYESALAQVTALLERGERYVSIVDMSQFKGTAPAEQRHLSMQWMKRNHARMLEQGLGVAFVISSPLVHLVISVFFHLQPMPVPYILSPNLGQAAKWAAGRLEEVGRRPEAQHIRERFGPPAVVVR